MDDQFDIIFRGDIAPGYTIVDVKAKLQSLFSLGDEQVNKLFSGRPVAIRKNLDQDSARKFQQAMASAGALVELRRAQIDGQKGNDKPTAQAVEQPDKVDKAVTHRGKTAAAAAELSAEPVGADVLKPEERKPVKPVQVKTDHLSMDVPGADVLRPDERRPAEDRDVDTSGLKVVDPD